MFSCFDWWNWTLTLFFLIRLFVDVKNGEPIPRKSILKSRSRENSVCSDTSESSAADFEERRIMGRSFSHDEATHSDTSDGITEEDSPTAVLLQPPSRFEVKESWMLQSIQLRVNVTFRKVSALSLLFLHSFRLNVWSAWFKVTALVLFLFK